MIEDGAERDEEIPNVDKLNSYFERYGRGIKLNKVDGFAGGNKAMQCDVFMAVINYLDPKFIEFFYTIEWEMPECVQLMLKGEDDDIFKIYVPKIQ